ncbi:MAG: hypothetical protein HZA36_03595 [Parcubacteria group bacterium]|nr:hypothetical protein [Parcubacteria group bacterium]
MRTISLWLAVNQFLFRRCEEVKINTGPTNKEEMATAWGEINKKYAFALAKQEIHENSREITQHYRRFFSRPIYHFLKLIITFFR